MGKLLKMIVGVGCGIIAAPFILFGCIILLGIIAKILGY